MTGMQLDHLSYAAGPGGLAETVGRLTELLGEQFADGGVHPRFGTSNMILPLAGGHYLEAVEVLDHPASDKAPFGQAARALSRVGGGWLGWVCSVDDIVAHEARLGRTATEGNRHRPDGTELRWRQIGASNLTTDPQLPVLIQWQTPDDVHPAAGATGHLALAAVEIAGSPDEVERWLGCPVADVMGDIDVHWVGVDQDPQRADGGPRTGVVAASVRTPGGLVQI